MLHPREHTWYRLDENNVPQPCTLEEWAGQYDGDLATRKSRIVKQTHINDWFVSTVFLGMDNGWGDVPMFFETMIFDHSRTRKFMLGNHEHTTHPDVFQERYSTYDEALNKHNELVDTLTNGGSIEMYNTDENDS